ncbi:hypothetical protein HYH03_013282 [Edaphochlamys debaryana]|uniref:Uncharacterized protein n=1 Tax=Edaphochlamys debaryana TaxID=47281 RepID=A0A835XR98_9CHLO|nr:hypothetical protein HYH03_013282 [Edaphochlamys debaryana]|eukprot:KAG2488137.1 hypothetical protein HYH03_013282 [Edaphochlamys debaryana]
MQPSSSLLVGSPASAGRPGAPSGSEVQVSWAELEESLRDIFEEVRMGHERDQEIAAELFALKCLIRGSSARQARYEELWNEAGELTSA